MTNHSYQGAPPMHEVNKHAVERLQELIPLVQKTELTHIKTWEFNTNEFKGGAADISENVQAIVKFLKGHQGLSVYRYTLLNEKEDKRLYRKFVKYKAKQKFEKKELRSNKFFNVSRPNGNQGPYLYVGSKIKDHHLRFRQHLGIVGRTVYSMYMVNWMPKNIEIRFELFSVKGANSEVMVHLEQALWDISKPMLGKQSGH